MLNTLLIFLAAGCYFTAAMLQILFLSAKLNGKQTWVFCLGLAAILSHGWLLYRWIDTAAGQNLSMFNLFSQAAWLVALLQLLLAIRKPVENLSVFIFPITGLSIILAALFPAKSVVDTLAHPAGLIHILLAMLAFSVLCIAACQALLLAVQDWQLRHKDMRHAIRILPPIESMERQLFQLILMGFILLSLLFASSVYFFKDIFASPLLGKTLLTLLAWFIFAALLAGRLMFGWRSRIAVRWTLAGVMLLLVCYLASKLLT